MCEGKYMIKNNEKFCNKCNTSKDITLFRKNKDRLDGLDGYCIDCRKVYEELYRENNRLKRRETQRKHYLENKDTIKEKRKINYDPIKGKARWMAKSIKAEKCMFCDNIGERHHKDYDKPLDIVFLCKSHHKMVHDGTIMC